MMKVTLVFLFSIFILFSCSKDKEHSQLTETSLTQDNNLDSTFLITDKDIKWRIFENNISDTLRIFRNNIFAKYGYKFNSKDLQKYYQSMEWYKINPEYNDSSLTKDDSLSIQTIKKYENLLNELNQDSIKILKNIFDFRNKILTQGFDTTVTTYRDITGDSISDSLNTKIIFNENDINVSNVLISKNESVWDEKHSITPCSDLFIDDDLIILNYPVFGYHYYIYTNLDIIIPRVDTFNIDIYDVQRFEGVSSTFYEYVSNFKGPEVIFSDAYCLYAPDISYKIKIWYEPEREFYTFFRGP